MNKLLTEKNYVGGIVSYTFKKEARFMWLTIALAVVEAGLFLYLINKAL